MKQSQLRQPCGNGVLYSTAWRTTSKLSMQNSCSSKSGTARLTQRDFELSLETSGSALSTFSPSIANAYSASTITPSRLASDFVISSLTFSICNVFNHIATRRSEDAILCKTILPESSICYGLPAKPGALHYCWRLKDIHQTVVARTAEVSFWPIATVSTVMLRRT